MKIISGEISFRAAAFVRLHLRILILVKYKKSLLKQVKAQTQSRSLAFVYPHLTLVMHHESPLNGNKGLFQLEAGTLGRMWKAGAKGNRRGNNSKRSGDEVEPLKLSHWKLTSAWARLV